MRQNPLLGAGLPFMTLVVLGSFGLGHLLQVHTCSTRRRAQWLSFFCRHRARLRCRMRDGPPGTRACLWLCSAARAASTWTRKLGCVLPAS